MYDLIIIGAGPSGLACAIEAEKNDLNYLILEKGVLVNSIYDFPINMSFFQPLKNWKLEIRPSFHMLTNLPEKRH